MIPAGLIAPSLCTKVREWTLACDTIPDCTYLAALNVLVCNGILNGWLTTGELWVLATGDAQSSLLGLTGTYSQASFTTVGSITYLPLYGAYRTDVSQESYLKLTGVHPFSIPGVTTSGHTLAVYLTTNYVGSYQEAGAGGTSGNKPFMIRGGSGFRSGAWSGNDQIIFGDGTAWGHTAFARLDGTNVLAWKHTAKTTSPSPYLSSANNDFCILSAEPTSSNSPNQVVIVHVGAAITEAQGDSRYRDFTRWAAEVGILSAIAVPPIVLGANCFGPTALDAITPSDFRLFRQLEFPATNATPASSTNAYPITDCMTRPYSISSGTVTTLGTDPIATSNGSATATVTWTAHGFQASDIIRLSGATAGSGLTTDQLNQRFLVQSVPTTDTLTVTLPATANATGNIGGTAATGTKTSVRLNLSTMTFTPPRSGKFWSFCWNNRGERGSGTPADDPAGPYTTTNFKGNDAYGPIVRMSSSGSILAKTQCRPTYTTKWRAMGATITHLAHDVGFASRNESRLTTLDGTFRAGGWGYLDIAEYFGLSAANVISWQTAYINADTIFTTALSGYAVGYDYVILNAYTLQDMVTSGWSKSRLGSVMDDEPLNTWNPTQRMRYLNMYDAVCGAAGFKWCATGDGLTGSTAASNGWDKSNAYLALALANLECLFIIAQVPVPGNDVVAFLQAQVATFAGPTGALSVDYSKLGMSGTTGTGKNSINDSGPLSPNQVPLDQCDLAGAWLRSVGIKFGHVRRVGMPEGGTSDRVPNQQIMRYFRNLAPTDPPESPPP